MYWQWTTRKGNERSTNNDAVEPEYAVVPINIESLITSELIENQRIEFKQCWNPQMMLRTCVPI
ncbi:MAG: hypothetical protein A6F72_02350 [Cycloclasticus sp. symbiont of Poecilosclerida sp. N]|nr:MAG: hypothetical protein A6F72_02350 [Cycloclasticus sp. symbiont of Poecilosclerida sp. N]